MSIAAWLQGYPVRRLVIVNSKGGGKDFRGVLWSQEGRYLVLRNAEMLRNREAPLPVDGEVVIPRENVEFLQVLGA